VFVKALSQIFRVSIVTIRPKLQSETITLDQISRFFPTVYEVYFANKNNNISAMTKELYCVRNNIRGFVDDDLSVCLAALDKGIVPVVFEQDWNADVPKEDGILRLLRTNDYNKIFTYLARIL